MQPFGHNRHGPKIGGCAPFLGRGSWIPIWHNVARVEAYLRAKFHLDASNRLATIHQRFRQNRLIQRSDSIGRIRRFGLSGVYMDRREIVECDWSA